MRHSARLLLLSIAVMLVCHTALPAFQYKKGNEVYFSGDFEEDLFLWGGTVNFDGNLIGDMFAGARVITFNGVIDGNVNAAGQRVTINGEVCRGVRCAAQTLNLNSRVNGDVVAFAASVALASEGVIGRDCALFGGEIFLDGTVARNAQIHGGTVTISGRIDGDVTIGADEIAVLPTAVIGGDLSYESKKKASISPQAQILGELKWKKKSRSTESSGVSSYVPPPASAIWSAIFLVGALLLGVIIVLLRRDWVITLTEEIKRNPLLDGLIGLLLIFVVPVVLILIAVTIIGLPVTVAGFAFYALVFLSAKIIFGITIGMTILKFLSRTGRASLGWSLLLGMVLLAILFKIPFLGWIVYAIAWAVGAGAMLMILLRRQKTAATVQATAQKQ